MIETQLGSYQIIEEVGRGGMATVYRAYQSNVDRHVALKVIQKSIGDDDNALERFQREARLIARLEHLHILPVYDFDGAHDPPYIVMRYLESGTLKEIMKQRQLALGEISYLVRQIAAALDYAHRQGIVHRDIKPSNIMIDRDGNAFVTDFGIARIFAEENKTHAADNDPLTITGAAMGTPDYMSPEQALGQGEVDHRADIYSLGVIVFQMATGRLPFIGDTPMQVMVKHIHEPMPSVVALNPSLPPALDAILHRALTKKPVDRYQSVAEFAHAVVEAIGAGTTSMRAAAEASILPLIGERQPSSDTQPTPSEQNKVVTAVYVNAVEYAEMVEALEGGEAAHRAVNELWDCFASIVEGYGGGIFVRIERDLLALWGAESSREDDPERGIHAALAMQDAIHRLAAPMLNEGETLPIGIGINTGMALLTPRGEQYTASGATISLASRLAQTSKGMVLVTHDTYRHVRGVFDMEPVEPLQVRGRKDKLPVYWVQTAKARAFRVNSRGVEGIETHMIGRDAELKHLQDAFFITFEDQETQVVTVMSEAGLGKSRLLYEFRNWAELRPERYWVFRARATPEITHRPYALLRDLLSYRFKIYDTDSAAVVQEKMEKGIASLLPDESTEMAHFIGHLVGYDFSESEHLKGLLTDPQQLTSRARQLFIRLFVTLCGSEFRGEAAVMDIEDIHWADDASLDLLNELVGEHQDLSLLLVCMARPILDQRRPTWGSGQKFHSRLELRPLSKRDSRNLVHEILQKMPEIPKPLRDLVVERAEGNPFYMEELIKMLIEDRVIRKEGEVWSVELSRLQNLRVPPTLIGLLQARLDSLLYPERIVLQRASVIGRIFWSSAVEAMQTADHVELDATGILKVLTEREFINERESSTIEDNTEYIFAHNMLRDTVYENLLKSQQRAYHAAVAEWLAAGTRADEYAALIADHYEMAGEYEKAVDCLTLAGEKALNISVFKQALAFFERALLLLPEEAQATRLHVLLKLGETHWYLSDYDNARPYLEQALRLASRSNDVQGQANALFRLSQASALQGDFIVAQAFLTTALPLAQYSTDQGTLARVYYGLGDINWRLLKLDEAKQYLLDSLAIAHTIGDQTLVLYNLNRLGAVTSSMGQYDEAQQYYEECRTLAIKVGNRERAATALQNMGESLRLQGKFSEAHALLEEALKTSEEIGRKDTLIITRIGLGLNALSMNKVDDALTYLKDGMKIALGMASPTQMLNTLVGFVGLRIESGDYDTALAWLGLALNHQAADGNVKGDAAPFVDFLQANLPPDQFEAGLARGAKLKLDEVIKTALQ